MIYESIGSSKQDSAKIWMPPPPNPYIGAAERIRAGANEIADEKKIGYQDIPPSQPAPDLRAGLQALYEGRRDEKVPHEKSQTWWKTILEHKYTPVVAGAISVLATDAAFVLLAASASPTAPATLAAAGICWGIGRVASLVGAVSTGYQYKNQLYGTTKLDVEITLATYGLSFIPKPDMAVMNHIGFLYSCYTTFIR